MGNRSLNFSSLHFFQRENRSLIKLLLPDQFLPLYGQLILPGVGQNLLGQGILSQNTVRTHHIDHKFRYVFQFTHITRPGILLQPFHHIIRYFPEILVEEFGIAVCKMEDQCFDILLPFPQRRDFDGDNIQAVIKILPEFLLPYHFLQIFIGGRQNPHIDRNLLIGTNADDLPFLQDTQQLCLQIQRHIADLIQENDALICQFELADTAVGVRSGKRALHITEQFRFQQRFRNRRAVDGHEFSVFSVTGIPNSGSYHFLARTAFSRDQNRGGTLGNFRYIRLQLLGPLASADNIPAAQSLNSGGDLIYFVLNILPGCKQQDLMVTLTGIRQAIHLPENRILFLVKPQHVFITAVHMVTGGLDHSFQSLRIRQFQLLLGCFVGCGNSSVLSQNDDSLGHVVHGIVQRSNQSGLIGLRHIFLGFG